MSDQVWLQPLLHYGAAWNAHDDEERLGHLRQAITPDCRYTDWQHDVVAPEGLCDVIRANQEGASDYVIELASSVEEITGCLRFTWQARWRNASGEAEEQHGADTMELADDGRIRRIIVFEGELPPPLPG